MAEKREFDNPYDDKIDAQLVDAFGKICQPWQGLLKKNIEKYLQQLESGLKETDPDNYSVYTGTSGKSCTPRLRLLPRTLYLTVFVLNVHQQIIYPQQRLQVLQYLNCSLGGAGIAFLYYHLSSTTFCQNTSEQQLRLSQALDILEGNLHKLRRKRVTFLCGDAGVYALSAVLYSKQGDVTKCEKCITKLCALCESVELDQSLPDELLYGRAGYLYSLLFVQSQLGKESVSDTLIEKIVAAILQSGLSLSRKERSRSPLKYTWHDKHYVGAAHGFVGILYMLLQVYPRSAVVAQHLTKIQQTVDYLLTKQFPSGNFPSSLENQSDRLVHWCHGAPGAVHLMLKAYEVFKEKRYLDAALSCGNVVWKRGLLKKGYGICHGVSGNAYTFLALYKQTSDQVYLHRALKFAEWSFSYGEHNCRTPDTPYSLFEGLAGTLYFWSDLFEPRKSRFPAFEL